MDSELIESLVACSRTRHSQPWPVCSFDQDFILVSEFSEIVGPRPVLTIPEDGGASFDKNTFTVRIMSVDCTAPVTVDAASNREGFHILGDTQVFLLEPSEGAVAYVHHFTLYDIHARGYVRPYCMAYVTNQHSKIMNNFALFREHFSRISAYFKFGNAVLFLQDLQRRLGYLHYTKRKLSKNLDGIPIGEIYELPRDMKSFDFDDIEKCVKDTCKLKEVILQYLNVNAFEEQREQLQDITALFSEQGKDEPDDLGGMAPLEELDELYGSLEPTSVGISSGRRFDIQLRDLQELCEPSKHEAMGLLRSAGLLFSNTKLIEEMTAKNNEPCNVEQQSKDEAKESKTLDPNSLGKEVFLNPKRKIHFTERKATGEDHSENLNFMAAHSFEPASIWMVSSCMSRNSSFEVIKAIPGSSDDGFFSSKDTDSVSSASPSIISYGTPVCMDQQPLHLEHYPGAAKPIIKDTVSNALRKSNHNSRGALLKSDCVDSGSPSSPRIVSWEDRCIQLRGDGEEGGKEDAREKETNLPEAGKTTSRQWSTESNKSSSSTASGPKPAKSKSMLQSKVRSNSKVSNGSASSKESVPSVLSLFQAPESSGDNNLNGISLMTLRKTYSFLPHLAYSLMIGRTVILSADRNNRHLVHSLLVSLLPCVPAYPRSKNSVVFWTRGPLSVNNLATVRLVGLAKSRNRGEPVPASILPYVSVLDVEKSMLTAPPYRGTYLTTIFDPQKEWPSDAVFHEYLHSVQLELSNQALMMFSWQFAGYSSSGSWIGNEITHDKNAFTHVLEFDPERFILTKYSPDDVKIINHLVRVVKNSFLGNYVRSIADSDDSDDNNAFSYVDHIAKLSHCETPSVRLNLLKCQVFTEAHNTKKK